MVPFQLDEERLLVPQIFKLAHVLQYGRKFEIKVASEIL